MKKYWKQSGAWVTAFVRKPVAMLAARLTALYALTILGMVYVVPSMGGTVFGINAMMIVFGFGLLGLLASLAAISSFEKSIRRHARFISDISHDTRNSLAVIKM